MFILIKKNGSSWKIKEIYDSINEKGFKLSATIYSKTDSSKVGGLIGWVNEKEISESITNKIKSLKNGEYTQPIQMPGGFLIIQINDKKEKFTNKLDKKIKIIDYKKLKDTEKKHKNKLGIDKIKVVYFD